MNITQLPIDAKRLLERALLVGTSPAYAYKNGVRTAEVEGYKYSVLLPTLAYEKLNIKILGDLQLDADGNATPVKFEGVEAKIYCIDGRYDISVTASAIHAAKTN